MSQLATFHLNFQRRILQTLSTLRSFGLKKDQVIIYTQLPRFNQTTWAPQLEECTKLQQKLSEVPDDVSERPDAKNMLVSPEMVEREHAKQGQAAARLQEGVQDSDSRPHTPTPVKAPSMQQPDVMA